MKTLHIIGAGFEQVPAIELAHHLGHRVVVTDRNPEAPGVKLADAFEQISTADKQGNLHFACKHHVNGVMTLGSELAVPVVAYLAEQLGLPGISSEVALAATNKNIMRKAFQRFDVPCPDSCRVNTLSELETFSAQEGWPIVIKPSDCSGQRGTGIFYSNDDLEFALSEALRFSSDGFAIVETFVEGPEVNVTAIVQSGDIEFLSFSHRITAEFPHFGIAIAHKAPVDLSDDLLESVKQASVKAIQAIGLENGIAYPQLIVSPDKGANVIEIAARIPGGYMRDVALISSGIDMIEVAVRQALSEPLPVSGYKKYPVSRAVIVKFLTELDFPGIKKLSIVDGFEGLTCVPGIYLSSCRLAPGDFIPELTSSSARFGAIIVRADSAMKAESLLMEALNSVVVK